MPVKVIVYILGLAGVINFNGNGHPGADIVLPNARFTPALNLPEHRAQLSIDRGKIAQTSPAGSAAAKIDLAGYGVEIRCAGPQKAGKGLQVPTQDGGVPWRSVNWIADVSQFAQGIEPRPELMHGDGGRVTAAMRLTEGMLSGARPTVLTSEFAIWELGKQKQALTDRMMYTLECASGAAELKISTFDGKQSRVYTLTPENGSEVVATVSNLPMHGPSKMQSGGRGGYAMAMPHLRAAEQLYAKNPTAIATGKVSSMIAQFDPGIDGTWDNPRECVPFLVKFPPRPGPDPGCIYCGKGWPPVDPPRGER